MTHDRIFDSGTKFQIVPSTRKVTVPVNYKVIGTVGDHMSEQLTFQCPKEIDGHNIEQCVDHYVTWLNADGELGHDHLELIGTDDDHLYYAWDVRGNTTVKAGLVSFSVHFEDSTADGKIKYRWSTAECKECEILDCITAAVGAFELLYVDDATETLVFADHTPVRDEALLLKTPGIVPSGTKVIDTNGHHDVANYAFADVNIPSERPIQIRVEDGGVVKAYDGQQVVDTYQLDKPIIMVEGNGTVSATTHGMLTTHTIRETDDPDLKPENIKKDVNIFGVTGSLSGVQSQTLRYIIRGYTNGSSLLPPTIVVTKTTEFNKISPVSMTASPSANVNDVAVDGMITVIASNGTYFSKVNAPDSNVATVYFDSTNPKVAVLRVVGDNPILDVTISEE